MPTLKSHMAVEAFDKLALFPETKLEVFVVGESGKRHRQFYSIASFQANDLTNVCSPHLEAAHESTHAGPAPRGIEPVLPGGDNLDFPSFREIGDIETHGEVT